MHDTLADDLQPALVRWTMGGAAAPLAPDLLKDHLGDDPEEAELRLLVLAGQALGLMVVPEPAGELQGLPDLPTLPLPTMPDRLRPMAARVLARNEEWLRNGVLRLIEARGHVVHPGDWMPTRSSTIPEIYAPWQDWLAGIAPKVTSTDPSISWDNLGTAGRRALLARLRRDDPSAGLALVADKAPREAAEARLFMVEALGVGLSEMDRPFLESLSTDRAPRVRTIASRLLMRLGSARAAPTGDDPAASLSDFIRVETKGILRRQTVIVLTRPRNHAQTNRRDEAMASIDARTLATMLGVSDVDLPAMWPWGEDPLADRRFADLALGTGSNQVVEAFEKAVANGAAVDLFAVMDTLDRLSNAAVTMIARSAYAKGQQFSSLVACLAKVGVIDNYKDSSQWRTLHLQLMRHEGVQANMGADDLLALGVLVTADAAREILDALTRAGIPSADPRLDTLRINAAL